jgi:RNA polymerase sigma-70 factor (ECF subfamily)
MDKGIGRNDFKQIFDTVYEPLKKYVYYKTGNIETAEDVVQETFIKLWDNREDVRAETVKPYLYKIATNIFLNHYEKSKVQFKFLQKQETKNNVEAPDYEMEMKEFDRKLQQSLSDMNEKARTVFLMNRIESMTYREIAENLGLSVKAVEKRMSVALDFLRQRIALKF